MDVRLDCSPEFRERIADILCRFGLYPASVNSGDAEGTDGSLLLEVREAGFPGSAGDTGSAGENPACSLVFDPARPEALDECLRAIASSANRDSPRKTAFSAPIITGKKDDCFEVIKLDDVLFFEASGDSTFCVTRSGRFLVKPRLYELENAYRERGFVRTGKAQVVNVMRIAEVVPWFGGKILLRLDAAGTTLEVARSYAKEFRQFLGMA